MSRHRGMQGCLDDYYNDEDYYDDYDDYDSYPQSAPKSATTSAQSKKSTNNNNNNNTPKKTLKASQNQGNANNSTSQLNKSNQSSKTKSLNNFSKKSASNQSTQLSSSKINEPKKQNSNQSTKPEPKLKNVLELYKTSSRKPVLNLVVIGHIDAGKSTLTGHLLVKRGLVSNQEFHKLSKEAEVQNKASFKFAYILDDDETEREKGVTINTSKRTFLTEKYLVSLADAPGHRDFVPNMISGAANADVGILVVDARPGEFESGFSNTGQTKEHALIAKSLGVNKLIIAVNKMDAVQWDKSRFDEIEQQLRKFLTKSVGFPKKNLIFSGVSGLSGENLTDRKFPKVPCLIELIDMIEIKNRPFEKPTRISITDLSTISEAKISCLCKIDAGSVQTGQHLLLQPINKEGADRQVVEVSAVYTENADMQEDQFSSESEANSQHTSPVDDFAVAGENVGLDLKPITFSKFETTYTSHLFLSDPKNPFVVATKLRANILILGGDAQTYDNVAIPPITRGFNVTCHINCIEVPGRITKLISILDRATGEPKPGKVRVLNKGNAAKVNLTLDNATCVDLTNQINDRFTVRIQGITIGSGVLKAVLDK